MTLITGIGDEVVGVTMTFLVMTLVTLVWRSTRVRNRISVVTVGTMNRHTSEPTENENHTAINENDPSSESTHNARQFEMEEPIPDDSECVTVRIRFIDETQFEVRSPLSATLSQFKSRHLKPGEGSPIRVNDRLKLIFNGKVLQSETSTLAQLGIQHNCTVHCLIQRESMTSHNPPASSDVHGDFDLSGFCYPLLGFVLFIIWWCQVVYSQYFTFTSSMSLVSLTILFVVSVSNTYINH